MGRETAAEAGSSLLPRPPKFLKTKRAKSIWFYLLESLDSAKLDYSSSLTSIALLADKIDTWRIHADAVSKAKYRYEIDSNGGSLESDESMAERRARSEVIKDLDETGLTVLARGRIKAIDRLANQGDLFNSPFEAVNFIEDESVRLPTAPPWTMRPSEAKFWRDMQPLLSASGLDFGSAGLSVGIMCAALADWFDCKEWIAENKGKVFAISYKTGRTYEVSASYNRAKISRQIRELFKKNGMTVFSCARNKAISKGRIVSAELAEILGYITDRPD